MRSRKTAFEAVGERRGLNGWNAALAKVTGQPIEDI
ncbi:MAG: hypothetical protein JWQ11_437 [Rhizobacter sp.]|nr:hypothetical protein [Rhizobacter sp.]